MMNRNNGGERTNKHGEDKRACFTSPASIGYWFAVSLVAWAILSLTGLYLRPFRAASATNILLAAGIGCIANWVCNRTLHCGITGPVFLLGSATLLLAGMQIIPVNVHLVWLLIFIASAIAFLMEWRWGKRFAECRAQSSTLIDPNRKVSG
jgi:hypothetical protein